MANKLILKKSSVAAKVPLASDLQAGELAVNLADAKLYTKDGSGNVILVGSGAAGAVTSVAGRTGDVTLTKSDVGLSNVDNTSDANKPVSTAQQTALDLKANLASPTLTGVPAAPTAAVTTSTTQIATTAFVNAEIANDAAPISHVGSGGTAHSAASTTVAGFMSAADKSKLDGIASGATANTGTVTAVTGTAPIVSSGGTAPAISISAATTLAAGSMSAADKSKLDGIASGATANTGTVTSVTAGTGLSGGTITTSGTIALANTAVTAGSYTNANITVDAQGRLTAAASGSAGGVTSVSGTAPIVSSGGSTPAISISAATTLAAGSMSASDKSKLDGIAAGATNVTNTNQLTNGAGFITSAGTSAACSGNAATAANAFRAISAGSYGSGEVYGSNGGWSGIRFNTPNSVFMVRDTDSYSGMYKSNSTWVWAFDQNGALITGSVPGTLVTGTVASSTYATSAGSITSQANSATITASSGVNASQIVQRDANGYIYANYVNHSSSETENPTINSIFVSNGDGWTRKASQAHFISQLGLAQQVANGCVTENSQTISSNYTMTSGKNGLSAGPITIATGVTVTIPTGSNWVIA